MTDNQHEQCPTHLLDDQPAVEDAFATDGERGPHQRVADAIADMIKSEKGGKAIGLEGDWGSGKSTVIRMLTEHFDKNDDYTVVIFDAWAHEGDPLRRTFIESTVTALTTYGWADQSNWSQKLAELARRKKNARTLVTPNATRLGLSSAISLLLIPLGVALMNAGLRQGVTLRWLGPINQLFVTGLFFALSPLAILLSRSLQIISCERRLPRLRDFAFMTNNAVTDTRTTTIETPEPTSIEFDQYFADLMSETLSADNRRLLLVLDNLDRVDSKTALSIWATLQTFLHTRDHTSDEWFQKLWVIVPYDPGRMKRLWNDSTETESDAEPTPDTAQPGNPSTGESFLDKSLQIRFRVAPPVLSNWKSYLYTLLEQALPGHSGDRHSIYRILDSCAARGSGPPTPRELKLYVNQVGAIHRQWKHEFDIRDVAYFVLACRQHPDLIHKLRVGDLPTKEDQRLLSPDCIRNIAGLVFNVKPAKGLELLLADHIADALKQPDDTALSAIASDNPPGFWAVLVTVAETRWPDEEFGNILHTARLLRCSGLLEQRDQPEKTAILHELRSAAENLQTLIPVLETSGEEFADLLAIVNAPEYSTSTTIRVFSEISEMAATEDKITNPLNIIRTALTLLDALETLRHSDSIPDEVKIPFAGEQWIEACYALSAVDPEQKHWRRFRPSSDSVSVDSPFTSKISNGQLSNNDVSAIAVTHKSAAKCNWQAICNALQTRLNAGEAASTPECHTLLSLLFRLELLKVKHSVVAQTALCKQGHLSHYFHKAKEENSVETQAAIILSFTGCRPGFVQPTSNGNSDAGHTIMMQFLDSPAPALTSAAHQIAERFALWPRIRNQVNGSLGPHALFFEVLKLAVDSEASEGVFTSELIADCWTNLRERLNDDSDPDRFERLVGGDTVRNDLCRKLRDADEGFTPEASQLYLDIIRGSDGIVSDFMEWCREGLESMDTEEWGRALKSDIVCCELCLELVHREQSPSLETKFTDALEHHSRAVIKGDDLPNESTMAKWPTLLACIELDSVRNTFRDRMIGIVIGWRGGIEPRFFTMYGEEISDANSLARNGNVLSHFFTDLLRNPHETGLHWLGQFSTENPRFLDQVGNRNSVGEFQQRLQSRLDTPVDDEFQPVIASIAANFGIEPSAPDVDASDDDAEGGEENANGVEEE